MPIQMFIYFIKKRLLEDTQQKDLKLGTNKEAKEIASTIENI